MRRAFALLLFVCSWAFVLPAFPARAATTSTPAPASNPPSFRLVAQPAWVQEGNALPLRLRVANAQPGLVVRAVVHSRLQSRTGFEESIGGTGLGSVIDTASVALDDVTSGTAITVAQFGMPGSDVPSDDVLHIRTTGVYPVAVELRSAGQTLDQFVTWVVFVSGGNAPGSVDEPLRFSWVWSAIAAPAHKPDGTPNRAVLAQMSPGGRLDKIAALLMSAQEQHIPLTLAVSPETLQSWLSFSEERKTVRPGAIALRDAASDPTNLLLPQPYVPIDLPAFENSGLGQYYSNELVQGADTLQNLTGRPPDVYTQYVEPVNTQALQRLHASFASQVLVQEKSLQSRQPNLTPARPFNVSIGTDVLTTASTNPTVESWLHGAQPVALRAQRFIAGLSLIALEAPAKPRGIALATPSDWTPDSAVVRRVLDALHGNPLVQPVSLHRYFVDIPKDTGSDGSTLTRTLVPIQPNAAPITASEYAGAQRALTSFRTLVGADAPAVARGERALQVALSTMLTPGQARAQLAVITHAASAFLGQITTTQQRITLTARRADIPISFRNGTGQPVRVRVTLAAPSGKALFPAGAQRIITLQPGDQTVRFTVEARATGTFAMLVSLTSDDGQLPIGGPVQITVRSTVFSGWGAALTVGALVFLAGWWMNHIWRTRRANRRAAAAPAAT